MTSRLRRAAATAGVTAALLVAVPGMASAAETPPPTPPVAPSVQSVAPEVSSPTPATGAVQSVAPEAGSTAPGPAGVQTTRPEATDPSGTATTRPTATAPQPGAPGQVSPVPIGAAETGDGSTAPGQVGKLLLFGALGLAGAAGAGVLAASRRGARRT